MTVYVSVYPLDTDEDQQVTSDGGNSDAETQVFAGALLCKAIIPVYDSLLLRYNDKECVQERLIMITCLKNLLSISHQAKSVATAGNFKIFY